jgi:hypothetical protein
MVVNALLLSWMLQAHGWIAALKQVNISSNFICTLKINFIFLRYNIMCIN